MKKVKVSIKGISALLMHQYPLEPVENIEKKTPEEQAEYSAYKDKEGELYIPSLCVQRALISAATYSKGKGRASLQKVVASGVMLSPEYLMLGQRKYEIDARPVVIPSTKGRIIRYRPRLNEWAVEFELEYDENLLSEVQVKKILDDCGSRVGLLDFRPERKGPFGKFIVTEFKS